MNSRSGAVSGGIVGLIVWAGMMGVAAAAQAADDASDLAATIDRLIARQWEEGRVVPAALAGDGEYLRRVTLDLTGRIPTASEVRDFLDDARPEKRERLVERLLDGPGFVTYFTGVALRQMMPEADTDPQAQALAPSFEAWLREQFAGNVGSDQIVRALLTERVAEDRSPAPRVSAVPRSQRPSPLPYYVAKDVKSENLAASTARLFLGIRLECAQCHNHPFASWTRDQFWGYAAFFSSLEKREADDPALDPIRENPERREATIPGTEKVVKATFLDGSAPPLTPRTPARMALADWMTAPENPFFARAAVNQLWAHFFGVGLVDPVDDMGADNPPSHPELLSALAQSFAGHGYDRKYLIRAITMSRTYQLTSRLSGSGATADAGSSQDDPRLFARMRERGLTAEQLYDSLAQAIGLTPEEVGPARFLGGGAGSSRGEFLEKFSGSDEKPTEAQTSILQALALMNGRLVAGATSLERGRMLSAVAEAPFLDTAGQVETLFLATLSRRPKPEEAAWMVAHVESRAPGERRKALSDVFWALLNSPEFLLNH